MQTIIYITVFAGIFGGTVNYFQLYSKDYSGLMNYAKCVVLGLGAAFLVPLFLQMISSQLVDHVIVPTKDTLDSGFIFLGFCMIAAIFSKRFIETIGEKILKRVEEVDKNASAAKQLAEKSKEDVDLLASKATEPDPTDPDAVDVMEHISATDLLNRGQTQGGKLTAEDIGNAIKALKDTKYTFRTLKGIIRDTGMEGEKSGTLLSFLKNAQLVKEVNKDGKVFYALTEKGNKVNM